MVKCLKFKESDFIALDLWMHVISFLCYSAGILCHTNVNVQWNDFFLSEVASSTLMLLHWIICSLIILSGILTLPFSTNVWRIFWSIDISIFQTIQSPMKILKTLYELFEFEIRKFNKSFKNRFFTWKIFFHNMILYCKFYSLLKFLNNI